MSKIQWFRRLFRDDYPEEYRDLIDRLSVTINHGLEQLYFLLSGRLDLEENFGATVVDFEVEVDSNGIPKKRTIFKLNTQILVKQVFVGKVENLSNPNLYPTSGVFLSWSQVPEGIIINHITGLHQNNRYRIRVTAIG